MKRPLIFLFATLLISLSPGCSATNRLTMGITEPAIVTLSPESHRVGIINRSLPSEKNRNIDKIDQVLSAEGRMLDLEGAQAAVSSLFEVLANNNSFEEVKIIKDPRLNKGLGILPSPLSWEEVEQICNDYGIDALFSLALYDTDTKVTYKATTMQVPNNLGIKVAVPAHELHLNTLIKNGWRIYDLKSRTIADQFICEGQVYSSGRGLNPVKAYEAILNRKEAVIERSMVLGNNYAFRLRPTKRRIARDYFVRGTGNFEMAKRRAQAGDWNGAAELWKLEVNHPKAKIAGRACYNMAIINEINGDLEAAIDWASKSYVDFRNNQALSYLNRLKYRQQQDARLQDQLSAR